MELTRCIFCIYLYSDDGKWWSCARAGLGDKEFTWRRIKMEHVPDDLHCDFILNPLVQYVASRKSHKAIVNMLRDDARLRKRIRLENK